MSVARLVSALELLQKHDHFFLLSCSKIRTRGRLIELGSELTAGYMIFIVMLHVIERLTSRDGLRTFL